MHKLEAPDLHSFSQVQTNNISPTLGLRLLSL